MELSAQKLVEIRRHLHRHPELSGEEFETTAFIRAQLQEAKIRIADYSLETGIVAEVGGKENGAIVAVRADIDALPIQETTGLPFSSQTAGKMHACGHDFHTASMFGAATLLKKKEHDLKGTVRFLFQAAEEKAIGASQMIEHGVLNGVRAIVGMHNKPDLPVGTLGIKKGPLMAAADGFEVIVAGHGTHAGVPEAGIDPIITAAHIVTALQTIVSRNIGALQSAVISVTRIHSGTIWNVIPDQAIFDGTLRTFDEGIRGEVMERFEQVVQGVAAAFNTTAMVRWIAGPPPVVNDEQWARQAAQTAATLGLNVVEPQPSLGGEDFAFYLKEVPGVFVFMGTSGPQEWHHPAFDVDEGALSIAANYFAALAVDALNKLAE